MTQTFHSNGKLLLTAEFLVVDGARALALPSRFGQSMKLSDGPGSTIYWKSLTHQGKIWFVGSFVIKNSKIWIKGTTDKAVAERLEQLFSVIHALNPDAFKGRGLRITTHLEFPRNWGLGSSSTLLANLAQWAKVNPFILADRTFGGSGYDVACAKTDSPLIYERTRDPGNPIIVPADFFPDFSEQLFFVHLNQKQNTRDGVAAYKMRHPLIKKEWILQMSNLTKAFLECSNLQKFENLMTGHEEFMGQILGMPPIKELLFPDFPGAIKSLGAWGGDFILATGGAAEKNYFKQKGYFVILDYEKMVL